MVSISPARCSWLSWKWSIVAAAFGAYFLADGCAYSFTILYSEFLNIFHQSAAQTAFVPALLMGLPLLTGFLVTPIVDSVGPDIATLIAMSLLFFSFFASSFSHTLTFISVNIAIFSAVGMQLTYVSALLSVAQAFPEPNPESFGSSASVGERRQRGLALGITTAGSGVGVMAFGPFMVHCVETYTWRGAMLLEAALFLHLSLIALVYRQLRWQSKDHRGPNRSQVAILEVEDMPEPRHTVELTQASTAAPPTLMSAPGEENIARDSLILLPVLNHSAMSSATLPNHLLGSTTREEIGDTGSSEFVKSAQPDQHLPLPTMLSIAAQRRGSLDILLSGRSMRLSELSGQTEVTPIFINPIGSRYHNEGPERSQSLERILTTTGPRSSRLRNSALLLHEKNDCNALLRRVSQFPSHAHTLNSRSVDGILAPEEPPNTAPPLDVEYVIQRPSIRSRLSTCLSAYTARLLVSMKGMLSVELWSNISFLVFVVADAIVAGAFTIYWTFAYDQALRLGLTPQHASIMLSVMGACSTINQLVWGALADVAPPLLVWLGIRVLGCVGLSLLALPQSVWGYTLLTCLTAFCYNLSLFPQNLLMLVGERLSYAAMGLYLTTMGVAVLAAPPLAGHLVDTYRSYSPALFLGGCVLGSAVLLILGMTLGEWALARRHWRSLSLFQFSAGQQ